MMNTLSSEEAGASFPVPVNPFLYRDMRELAAAHERESRHSEAEAAEDEVIEPRGPSPEEIDEMLAHARAEAVAETEARLKAVYEAKLEARALGIRQALDNFSNEQKSYFSRVEAEIVQLALAIAAKILHREAQVDPLLVAALVRVAVDKLHDGSKVVVRVSPKEADRWRKVLNHAAHGTTIEIKEDADLGVDDCVLETDLGSANFSIDAQLKEVEQGFFDLLAQRPAGK